MPDGLDLIMRPVLRGMCKMESLLDGTLSLEHIALMNEAIDSFEDARAHAEKVTRSKKR